MRVKLPVRQAIFKRKTYDAPAEGRKGKIRLDFNENTSGCSDAARKAVARMTAKEIGTYPEYDAATKEIARYFGVRAEELLLANGGDDALRTFFDTFVEARSHILICEPTFPMYRFYAEIVGARVETARYDREMRFPLKDVVQRLKQKPSVLFVANPNNPTGTAISQAEVKQLLEAARETVVVMDEAYAEFAESSSIGLIRKYPQLFVVRTFSKALGLAGMRLGAVIGQKDSLALVKRTLPPYPVNGPALEAGIAALRDKKYVARYVGEVKLLRGWFSEELQRCGAKTYQSAGNFVLADFGKRGPGVFRELAKRKILVRQRKDIGEGFARITIGTRKELRALLAVVKKVAGGKR